MINRSARHCVNVSVIKLVTDLAFLLQDEVFLNRIGAFFSSDSKHS